MPDPFQEQLQNPAEAPTNPEIVKEIEVENEKDFYKDLKKRNKNYLVGKLDTLERDRIAEHICNLLEDALPEHKLLCDRIDEYDKVHRMERKEIIGSDGDDSNYRTPISTVTVEVVHANVMNVFFSPKDPIRVLPTEENDVSKVGKLGIFANWSAKNELRIFENCDRLFHHSSKVGEAPYIIHWVKKFATEIKRDILTNPADPSQPLIDPLTQEPLYQEREISKLTYNGPSLEPFSRKDYIQPKNALMDALPDWEARKIRITYDKYLRDELSGKMFNDSIKDITNWAGSSSEENKIDYQGQDIPLGEFEQEFYEWYGRLRINIIKDDDGQDHNEVEDAQELEDEFIALVHKPSQTLCQLRKNKFPLKERPIGVDYFIPDDEGRRCGIGIIEFMDSIQKSYDALFNQFLGGVIRSNNPFGFFSPMANQQDTPQRIKGGYMYPSPDPNSAKFVEFPPPNASINVMLELVHQWAQLLFGISEYAAGIESTIDPSAPAKKAEIVVNQGNVRLNMIIKRKNKTLQDIMRKWFLLYQVNLPPNKFMRIAGEGENPWQFNSLQLSDFALNSLPDFELTGNILNVNKALEANKAIAVYQLLIANPLFNPATAQGLKALIQVTKWMADKLDETGVGRFIPSIPGEDVKTPEEENARFLQGDEGEPVQGEDHVYHIKVHQQFLFDPSVPDEIKQKLVIPHIQATVKMMQDEITQQMVMTQIGIPQTGGMNGGSQNRITGATNSGMVTEPPFGVG